MTTPDVGQIYTDYHGKVMGYIRARVQSAADAEDLCSDVFEKVFLKIGDYDSEKSALSTWIFTITRNTVIDFFRRNHPSDELDENIPDDSEVDAALLRTETLSELAMALRHLPAQFAEIVVLRYYDNKPLTEIADRLGISYGAVKLRHQAALKALREALGEN
ncbi:MAG: sigma-70 family RNA polymerase sigma factor [Clostridia bacterium]|nr:sigma-70 family RNA polymerase sigma factor [Clostridia bacterium]